MIFKNQSYEAIVLPNIVRWVYRRLIDHVFYFPMFMRTHLIRFRFVDFQYRNRRGTEK